MTFPSYLTLEPIDPIEGDPSEVRRFAGDLRRMIGRLDVPRQAAVSLQAVRHSAVWDGDAFLAFLTLVEKLPKPVDIDNAVDQFHWLAAELDTFADVLDECQAENRRCRRELDDANPPDAELTDEVLSHLSGITLQASRTLDRLDEASVRLRDVFDAMDRRTIYAEPPPSTLERIGDGLDAFQKWNERVTGEFVIGIGVGAWETVKGVGMLAFYLNPAALPFTAKKLWQHRESIGAVATFARQHPRLFTTEMGKAMVDWETLDESPARWLGKMVPDLLLTIATAGSGSVATKGAEGTVRTLRTVDRLADVGEDVSRAGRVLRRGLALLGKTRITLHEGVENVDKAIDPFLKKTRLGMLDPDAKWVKSGINHKPTAVKDLVTGGWYSRTKVADHWVNGVPGMTGPELARFLAPRALSQGGTANDLQQLDQRFHALTTSEPAGPGPHPGPRPPDAVPVPGRPPDVHDRAPSPSPSPSPSPPPRRFQTTSSAGPP